MATTIEEKSKAAAKARRLRALNPEQYRESARLRHAKHLKSGNGEFIRRRTRRYMGLPEPSREPSCFCECCGTENFSGRGKNPRLDHSHETGDFRGWLCNKCNLGIGLLGDSLIGVMNAVKYLHDSPYMLFADKMQSVLLWLRATSPTTQMGLSAV